MYLKHLTCFWADDDPNPVNIVFTESFNPREVFDQIITIVERLVDSENVRVTHGK